MDHRISLPLVLLLLATLPFTGMTQQFTAPVKPDYKWIESASRDDASPYSYKKLMARYKADDTTLSDTAFRVLYYGFLFQPEFSAYGISPYSDSIRVLFSQDSLRMADFPKITRFESLILDEFPFNLRDLNAIGYAYERMGDTANAIMAGYKLQRIFNTILSTGDGISDSTAWHVIAVGHEYDLINLLGFQYGGEQSLTTDACDYLTVRENRYGIEGLYFDVKELMNAESRALDQRTHKKKEKERIKIMNMNNMKTALVIGATGLVGSNLVDLLLADPGFSKVIIFVRRTTGRNNPKLEEHVINFDLPDTWSNLVTGDVLFSCLGTTIKKAGTKEAQYRIDYTYQYEFAKIAASAKVHTYVLISSSYASPQSRIFYSKMKGELDRDVKMLNFPSIHIIKPGILEGKREEERPGESTGIRMMRIFSKIPGLKKLRPIPARTVAMAMINASRDPGLGIKGV